MMVRWLGTRISWLGIAAFVLAPAVLELECGAPLTAPTGATLTISADPLTLPISDGVSTVTVRGFKDSSAGGGPLADGTQIFFSTPVGTIDERVEMKSGVARASLRSDGRSGLAAVVASSGSGVSVTLNPPVIIGNASGLTIVLMLDPLFVVPPNFTTDVVATVFDASNRPQRDVPLIFTATAGVLASAGSVLRTDALGRAADQLALGNERFARVTAFSGSFRSNTVTVIRLEAGGGPIIATVSPSSGAPGQTVSVNITGANFQSGSAVRFGDGITVTVVSITANLIRVTLSIASTATAGDRDVTVQNPIPDNRSDTLPGGFTVVGPPPGGGPTIATVSPSRGARGQTVPAVNITGANFQSGSAVSFGDGIMVTVDSITANLIRVTLRIASSAAPGARDVTVRNPMPDNRSGTLPGGFTVN